MTVIQDEVSIRAVPNKYGSQYQQIKDLISKFEFPQQYRISNKQKKLVENSNHNHISWWTCAHLHYELGHHSYTEWEMKSTCCTRILLKYTHLAIFNKYGVLKLSLTRTLLKIYPLLQGRNLNHL